MKNLETISNQKVLTERQYPDHSQIQAELTRLKDVKGRLKSTQLKLGHAKAIIGEKTVVQSQQYVISVGKRASSRILRSNII